MSASDSGTAHDVANAAHFRIDAHEGVCAERHTTIQRYFELASSDRKELKDAIHKIEGRMWTVLGWCCASMFAAIVSLIGGILAYMVWLANNP